MVYSLTGNKNELWIGRQRGGLTHLTYDDGRVSTKTYTQAQGLVQNSAHNDLSKSRWNCVGRQFKRRSYKVQGWKIHRIHGSEWSGV